MIPRYSNESMTNIWSEENKFKLWLDIEIAACEVMEESKLNEIPKGSAKIIKEKAKFDLQEIYRIEKETKHEVIAFITCVMNSLTTEEGRYLHMGLTSSDIMDTSFSMQLRDATGLIIDKTTQILNLLKEKALKYKHTHMVGRTHNVHAEPITLGLKFARYFASMKRCLEKLEIAKKEVSICMISGAVGTYAHTSDLLQKHVSPKLGLYSETISSQIIPRDRHAFLFTNIAILAGIIENIVLEIRNLQRTEIDEIREPFSKLQKGSSAMPHKRNPILSENLTGLMRLVRGYTAPALENIVSWHERDISHSSVERVIGPDATTAMFFALNRLEYIITNLDVDETQITKNLELSAGKIFSQRIMLKMIDKGLGRLEAYEIMQKQSMDKNSSNLKKDIFNNKDIRSYLSEKELESILDLNYYSKYVDNIYAELF